jgi:hypothetical protein
MGSLKGSLPALLLVLTATVTSPAARAIDFDFASATPIGSWQLREDTMTDHKNRKTGSTIRTSMLSTETRDGVDYYWVQMEMNSFKYTRKGERKPEGDRMVMKMLVEKGAYNMDPGNVLNNLGAFGKEIIMQAGDQDPMRISEGGAFAGMMTQAMGTKADYTFSEPVREAVQVPAGEFDAQRIDGTGSVETKVLFRKIVVESESSIWLSESVPFGIIRQGGTDMVNGKPNQHEGVLLEFGTSGAVDLITKEPQEMPGMDIPGLGDIFKQK